MTDNNKKYLINVGDEAEIWTADMYAQKSDKLFSQYSDAAVFEVEDTDNFDEDPTDYQYIVSLGDESEVWDGEMAKTKGARLKEVYPDAKIQRVSYKDYWVERATANRNRRALLTQFDADRNARLAELGYYDDLSEGQLEFNMDTNLGFGLKPLSSAIETSEVTGQMKYLDPAVQEFFASDSANTERMAEIARLDAEYDSNPAVIAQREWESQEGARQSAYIDSQLSEIRAEMGTEVNVRHAAQGAQTKHGYDPYGANMTVQAIRMLRGEDVGQDVVENEEMETYQSAYKLFEMAKQANEIAGKGFWAATGDVAMNELRNLATQSDVEMYNEIGDILSGLESKYGSLNNLTTEQIESGLSKAEKALIRGFFAYNAAMVNAGNDMSTAYKGGKIFGESVNFMLQFLATGGIARGTGKAAGNIAGKGLMAWARKAAAGTAARTARAFTARAARGLTTALVGSAARTIASPGTYTRMAERTVAVDREGHLNRVKNATIGLFDSYIENLSEITGGVFGKTLKLAGINPAKLLGKIPFGKIGKLLANNRFVQSIFGKRGLFGSEGFLKQFGFNGFLGEIEEEYIGALMREVSIQPGALAEMHKDDNFGAMLIGFAPMTLFGAGMSAAHMAALNVEASNLDNKLRETLGAHYDSEHIDHFINLAHSAESGEEMKRIINTMLPGLNEQEAIQLYQYGDFMARYKTMLWAQREQEDNLAQAKREQLEQTFNRFWQQDAKGNESVQQAELRDGRKVFVTSAPTADGVVTIVDAETGRVGFSNISDFAEHEQDGVMVPSTRTWSMNAYLEALLSDERLTAEQARMTRERDAQIQNLQSQITNGTRINLGTEGNPVNLLATGQFSNEGVYAVDSTGATHVIPWSQVADAMKQPIIVKTDQQLIDEEMAAIVARNSERRKRSGEANIITESLEESASQAASAVAQENKHIPMNEDGTVNEAAFWEQDPEGYAAWNDEQNQDGGADTREQIAISKAMLTQMLGEAVAAQQNSNPAVRKQAKQNAADIQAQIDRLTALEAKYEEQRIAPFRERAMKWIGLTNAPVHIIETEEELARISGEAAEASGKGARVRGLAKDGKAYIYLPGITEATEIDAVFMHEAVAHTGLKGMLGQQAFDELCDQVWEMMSPEMKRAFIDYPGVKGNHRAAAEEYIAHLAETMGVGVATVEEKTIWQKIIDFVRKALRAMGLELNISESELSDLLQLAYQDLAKNMAEAEKIVAQNEAATQARINAPTAANEKYDKWAKTASHEEIKAGAQNEFDAAQQAYNDLQAQAPKVEMGESVEDFIARKKAHNEAMAKAKALIDEKQAMMDEIARRESEKKGTSNNYEDDFFNDNTPASLMKQLDLGIRKGEKYGLDKLVSIYNQFATDSEQKKLAERVFAVARQLGLNVSFMHEDLGWNIAGRQDGNLLKIARIATLEQNKGRLANILLHETIHGVTTYAIDAYKNGDLTNAKMKEAVEQIIDVYESIKKNESLANEYGVTNEKEMIAELANPVFRLKLKAINLWNKLKEAIKSLFFFENEKDVTAERVLVNALDQLLENYDVSLFNEYEVGNEINEEDWNFYRMQDNAEAPSIAEPFMEMANNDVRLSIRTEEGLQDNLQEFINTKEGQETGWTEQDLENIIAETSALIDAIHESSTGNEFYDAFAQKNPTIRVDWRDGVAKPTVTWTRANIDYKYDMSADLLCINNEGLEAVLSSDKMVALMELFNPTKAGTEKVVDENGKVVEKKVEVTFGSADYLELYNTLKDLGFVVPCKGCFDAAGRFKMLPSVATKFAQVVNSVIDERNRDPEAFDAMVKATAGEEKTVEGLPTTAENKLAAIRIGVAGDKLTEHVKWTQLMSADGQTKMLSDWGGIFRAWQRTGAGRPKDKLLPEPYYGDIVSSHSTIIGAYGDKTPSFRDILVNAGTGLRRNSHSEFRPVLAIDEIQFMRDAFIKNLTVFKYMKELDDVRLFGKIGVKFNMSFFPEFVPGTKAAGLDANGDYIASEESVGSREFPYIGEDGKRHYDGMKGWAEAQKHINKDVSLSSVIFSIPHLIKALTDVPTRSDKSGLWGSLIPYHASGATASQIKAQGLGSVRAIKSGTFMQEAFTDYDKGVTNFEDVQNDRFGEGWVILEGKKKGQAVTPGHKMEFANGTHYYNADRGVHIFSSGYILDAELPEGALLPNGMLNLTKEQREKVFHKFEVSYNDKVRELKTAYAYQDAADYYLEILPQLGIVPRFDFAVPENIFLEMCEAANANPRHPKLGWKGEGYSWSPIDSEAYYALFCDYGMTDPATGKYSPHKPVGYVNEEGQREFRLPDNTVEIVREGLQRFADIRRSENARIDEAIEAFAARSVAKGRISQEAVDKVLSSGDTRLSVISSEMDADYLTAVERGDMETAQRMVLEAAKLAMPNTKVVDENGNPMVVYHGTNTAFTEFQERYIGSLDPGYFGRGFYFTPDKSAAEAYAKSANGNMIMGVFLDISNPIETDMNDTSLYGKRLEGNDGVIVRLGEGGIVIDNTEFNPNEITEVVVKSANQIKSADPVTYDDAGNVIPLSERFNPENSDIRFSVIGEVGALRDKTPEGIARLENLDIARQMESQLNPDWSAKENEAALKIKVATGWERGADGLWRYEVEDVMIEPINQWIDSKKKLKLGDIVKDGEVMRLYPDLADITIVKKKSKTDLGAAYNPKSNTIKLPFAAVRDARDAYRALPLNEELEDLQAAVAQMYLDVLHEVQHAIQHREGFAKGGNSKTMTDPQKMAEYRSLRKQHNDLVDQYNNLYNQYYAIPSADRNRANPDAARLLDEMNTLDAEIDRIATEMDRMVDLYSVGKAGYKKLAGEVESRNVETRIMKSAEERRTSLLSSTEDVARKDQIFIMNAMEQAESSLRFSIANENQAIFVSNAARAVEGIKMEKATPAQWLAMIEKAGGLKAGEDKWMGLSDWLKESDKKTLTKAEVLEFVNEHAIKIEETHYDAYAEEKVADAYAEMGRILQDKFNAYRQEYYEQNEDGDLYGNPANDYAIERLREELGDEFPYDIEMTGAGDVYLTFPYEEDEDMRKWSDKLGVEYNPQAQIENIRLDYTTDGLTNKREIVLTVPTIEPWGENDMTHFGDAGEGRAVAWIRFGDTYINEEADAAYEQARTEEEEFRSQMEQKYGSLANGMRSILTEEEYVHYMDLVNRTLQLNESRKTAKEKKVLVIDEIQSERHQEGREKGYITEDQRVKSEAEHDNLRKAARDATARLYDFIGTLVEKYPNTEYSVESARGNLGRFTVEDRLKFSELVDAQRDSEYELRHYKAPTGIPEAPFEKNWHELAMKRMLRYAAENGYDAIAWTKGEQQAERYGIAKVVKDIYVAPSDVERYVSIKTKSGDAIEVPTEPNSDIIVSGDYKGQRLSDVVGKELADKILSVPEGTDDYISGDDLKLGGEGMKGFYDKILPAFMNKYGKKWGIKVADITLPNVEEAGRVMHSVPVTDAMKESVMEGQVMFSAVQIDPAVRQEMDTIKAKAMWDGTFMKAPNGVDTKLTEDQWLTVRTKNFINWFGDWINDPENASKVVDENGEPMVVYHGTGYEGNVFTSGFFASDEQFATDYGFAGNGFNSRVVSAFIKMANPRVVDADYANYDEIQVGGQTLTADDLVRETKKDGVYDGLIIKNVDERSTDGFSWTDDIIPFASSQIKSATETTGLFSESGDIRYSSRFDVNTNPTEAQKKAGNYKMGHLRLDGYNITIENPKGSVRRGTDSKGNEWENTLNNDYGYIRGTEGVDGDHIDVYLSDNPAEGNVFVIDQVNPETREFDEHKVMYGFNSMDEAREAYLANFSEGWNGLGTITEVTKDEFRKWIDSSHRKTKPFSEYKSVKADSAQSEENEEVETRFSVVTDPALLDQLNNEEYITLYRAMQVVDGGLYQPMAGKVAYKEGEEPEWGDPIPEQTWLQSDETPWNAVHARYDKATKNHKKGDLKYDKEGNPVWVFKLNKGNGKSLYANYNPYIHTSFSPLNDQFSEAQDRDNLVVVRVLVPKSELTSGYKAEKAHDAVGTMPWHSGPISGVLAQYEGKERVVMLTRYAKIDGIVPWTEVADEAMNLFEDTELLKHPLPTNVFMKGLREELESRGVQFIKTDNGGEILEGEHKGKTWAKVYGKDGLGKKPKEPKKSKKANNVRFSAITPEIDAEYLAAVERGDMETAQKMVLEAAKLAMPNTKVVDENGYPKVVRHISENLFTEFEELNPMTRTLGFFTDAIDEVDKYIDKHFSWAIKYDSFLNIENPKIVDFKGQFFWAYKDEQTGEELTTDLIAGRAKRDGVNDGVIMLNVGDEFAGNLSMNINDFVPFYPSQIKSADPVTYDDEGNVIPLSQRFNPEKNDIRFSAISTPTDNVVAEGMKFSIQDFARLAGNIFQNMPESFRKEAIEETFKRGWDMQSAIFQIPARLAEKENWDEADKDLAKVIREKVQDAMDESGVVMSRPLTTKEALWMLYRSTGANTDSMLDAAKRSIVAHNLGFDSRSMALKKKADDNIRYSVVRNGQIDAATDMYNYEANLWTNRLKESWLDMNQSVIALQDALEKASGKPIASWENVVLALNQLSSKSYADKKKYMRDFLQPLWDAVMDIVRNTDFKIEDIERYMMLKHGLERNKKFAMRDAKQFYREMYDKVADRMKNTSHAEQVVALSEANKRIADIDAQIAAASGKKLKDLQEARERAVVEKEIAELVLRNDEQQNEADLQMYFNAIEAENNPKYAEFREKDYGGLTSMFMDQIADVKRSDYKTDEAYQAALLASVKPRFDKVADMEAEAQKEVADYESKADMPALWKLVNAATKETLRHQHAAGVITTEQYDAVRTMFDYYVPLRGFADNTAEDMYSYYMNNSAGGFAKPIIAARGRKTKAESPLGWIGTMAESAIQQDNKNEAKMKLYYALMNRPDTGVLSLTEMWYVYDHTDSATGKKVFVPAYPPATNGVLTADQMRQHMDAWEQSMKAKQAIGEAYKREQGVNLGGSVIFQDKAQDTEHIIRVKVAGKDYAILVNGNPRAAQSINGLLNPDANVGPVRQWYGALRRGMSALMTSFSPLFWVSNYQRDLLSSFMRTSLDEGWGQAAKYLGNRFHGWKAAKYIYAYDNGTMGDSYYENLYKEFAENGGITGYTSLTTNKEYEKLLADYAKNIDKDMLNWIKGAWDKFMGLGEAVEQVSRFAAYITARESGKSIEEAVAAAKEVSVNFNRKGSTSPISLDELKKLRDKNGKELSMPKKAMAIVFSAMPSALKELYFFFNASIQALSSSAKLAKKSPGKAMTWAGMYMGLSVGLAFLNYLLAGDDDDNDYLDLPDYVRHSTALFKMGDNYYFKWSLPQEMRPFYATADILVSKAMGKTPHKNVGAEILLSMAEWLPVNPFGTEDPILALVPDVAAPLAEIKANQNSFGGKIYDDMSYRSEEVVENIPAYRKGTSKTGKIYVDMAEFLNDISGGDEVKKGAININPAIVEHLVEGYGGGIYDFGKMVVSIPGMILDAIEGEGVEVRDIPFVNKVLLSTDETNMNSHVNEAFYYYQGIADNAKRVENEYHQSDDPSRAAAYRKESDWRIYLLYKQYEEDFKEIKAKLDEAMDETEIELIREQQNALRQQLLNDIANDVAPDPAVEAKIDVGRAYDKRSDLMAAAKEASKSGDPQAIEQAQKALAEYVATPEFISYSILRGFIKSYEAYKKAEKEANNAEAKQGYRTAMEAARKNLDEALDKIARGESLVESR